MTTYNTTGTIAVTSGSTAVTGSGSNWSAAGIASGTLYVEGAAYPVLSVASDTGLTLAIPYAGTTGSGKTYAIAVEQQILAATTANANRLAVILDSLSPLSDFATFSNGLMENTNPAAWRSGLELGSLAIQNDSDVTLSGTSASPLEIARTGSSLTSAITFTNAVGSLYAGAVYDDFAIGPNENLLTSPFLTIGPGKLCLPILGSGLLQSDASGNVSSIDLGRILNLTHYTDATSYQTASEASYGTSGPVAVSNYAPATGTSNLLVVSRITFGVSWLGGAASGADYGATGRLDYFDGSAYNNASGSNVARVGVSNATMGADGTAWTNGVGITHLTQAELRSDNGDWFARWRFNTLYASNNAIALQGSSILIEYEP